MNQQELLEQMRDDLNIVRADVEVIKVRIDMLSKVVYGAVSVVLLAVLTAAMSFVIKQ